MIAGNRGFDPPPIDLSLRVCACTRAREIIEEFRLRFHSSSYAIVARYWSLWPRSECRTASKIVRGSPFRLFGTASVGSQSLTGIARLHQLRNDPKLVAASAVWPFDTGWATGLSNIPS